MEYNLVVEGKEVTQAKEILLLESIIYNNGEIEENAIKKN